MSGDDRGRSLRPAPSFNDERESDLGAELIDVVVWVLVDEDGEYVAECDPDALKERYEADVGELDGAKATRLVSLTVKMPRPKAVELVATIGDEPAGAELKVA